MASGGAEFPINGGTYAPFGVITADDHGSYVVITTWIFACISVLFVTVRIVLRTWTSRRFGLDNALTVAALCFAIGQSVAANESVRFGLGRHFDTLSGSQISSFYRSIFASNSLSVFVFVFAKLSLVTLISHITPSEAIRVAVRVFSAFIILWGLSDILSTSFQCGARVPMRAFDHRCVDERALVFAHGIINIVTDFFIIILPIFIVWKVQIKKQQRFIVLALFWPRMGVCVTAGIQLGTMRAYLSGQDPTWNYLYPSLWNQVTVHLSVITACIPSIKPFFDSLQSSLIDSGIPRNYSNNLLELRPWKGSNKSSSRSSRGLQSTLRRTGLVVTTQNEIEGGVVADHASTKGLTNSTIHQQRDVDVVIAEASEESRGFRRSYTNGSS